MVSADGVVMLVGGAVGSVDVVVSVGGCVG